MPGVWEAASPESLQAARFRVVQRALERVGAGLSPDEIAEARSLIDPVVAGLGHGGKPLAAANASVALPDDPLVALWQQLTVVREWRGDAHIAVLVTNELGPCECLVLQVSTGRFPLRIAQVTRRWTDEEWGAATDWLVSRGWLAPTALRRLQESRSASVWKTRPIDSAYRYGSRWATRALLDSPN